MFKFVVNVALYLILHEIFFISFILCVFPVVCLLTNAVNIYFTITCVSIILYFRLVDMIEDET